MFTTLSLAIKALKTNKLRSILTMGGVIIGIATVIIVMSLGNSTEKLIIDQIQSFGSNTIFAEVKVPSKKNVDIGEAASMVEGITITSLKEEDAKAAEQIPNVVETYSAAMGEAVITYRNKRRKTSLIGTNEAYIRIDKNKIGEGRFFTKEEDIGLARVAVLGKEIKEELFGEENAIGKSIRIKNVNFRVVGVMAKRGTIMYMNMDKMIYLPLNTIQKLILGIDYIIYFVAQIEDEKRAHETAQYIKEILRRQHNITVQDGSKDDFRVTTIEEAMDMMRTVTGGIQIFLITLAAISLIVGGIGIMNIMYVSVSERTREIGLRKALGAKKRTILMQFLFEAIIITIIGGVIGITFGIGVYWLISFVAKTQGLDFAFGVSIPGIIIAVSATAFEGVIFGLYPARKAAKMNAIEALRYE